MTLRDQLKQRAIGPEHPQLQILLDDAGDLLATWDRLREAARRLAPKTATLAQGWVEKWDDKYLIEDAFKLAQACASVIDALADIDRLEGK